MSAGGGAALRYYYVAFLDLLGFSEMVKKDCHSPPGEVTYLDKLHALHVGTRAKLAGGGEFVLSQFSDSVVLAAPFAAERFGVLLGLLREIQYDLFKERILCRGGVAVGKHYSQQDFLFSEGLIDAYNLERFVARFPRVVVSPDLLQLVAVGPKALEGLPLVEQEDGVVFVDYLAGVDLAAAAASAEKITSPTTKDASVREKHRWVLEYVHFKCKGAGLPGGAAGERFRLLA